MKLRGKAKEEFLRRMARGRRAKRRPHKKHKRSTPPHPKRRKRHHPTPAPMAKKKRKSHHRKSSRKHRSHHRHHGGLFGSSGGSLRGRFLPTTEEAIAAGTAGVYGYLEGAAAKDKEHVLAKMPVPIASLGRSGTVGVGLWLLGAVTRKRFLRCMARGVVDVAAYQMLRRPTPFGKAGDKDTEFAIAGLRRAPLDTRTPAMIEAHLQRLGDDDDDDDGDD
jgi:hypothetical protein